MIYTSECFCQSYLCFLFCDDVAHAAARMSVIMLAFSLGHVHPTTYHLGPAVLGVVDL